MIILGLDISTSCTGITIMDNHKNLLLCNYIEISKCKGLYSKAEKIREAFNKINEEYDISHIFVEENLQKFRPGFSSAKVLTTLSKFNGIVCYIANEVFKKSTEPININVVSARKSLGLKIQREKKCGVSTKDQVLNWVSKDCESIVWPTKVLKSGPRKGMEIISTTSYDMADSYVIAVAGLVQTKC